MRDLFGKGISDITTSRLNIPSAYEYNPERLRLEVDGQVVQPEYDSVPQYNHAGKVHELIPQSAGETVALQSAERPSYVVQYESAASFAFAASKKAGDLVGDDRIRVGRHDGGEGWAMEFNSSHSDNECDLIILRGGSVTSRTTGVNVREALDLFTRILGRGAWYDVSRHKWEISVAIQGEQVNSQIGRHGMAGNGPNTPNLPVRFEVRADEAEGLTLDAGSMGMVVYGPSPDFSRGKELTRQYSIGQTGDFEPLAAFRADPDRSTINFHSVRCQILEFTGSGLIESFVQSFSVDKVGFADTDSWGVPPEWSETNNMMEYRNDPNSIPDNTGAPSATVSDPGGFQLDYFAFKAGQGNDPNTALSGVSEEKKNVTEDRIAVVMGRVEDGGSTGDVMVYTKWAQDW